MRPASIWSFQIFFLKHPVIHLGATQLHSATLPSLQAARDSKFVGGTGRRKGGGRNRPGRKEGEGGEAYTFAISDQGSVARGGGGGENMAAV